MASKPARGKWLGYAVFNVLSMPYNRPNLLDKLGVTGSSPVPTIERALLKGLDFGRGRAPDAVSMPLLPVVGSRH
jgi:hypothetical protein